MSRKKHSSEFKCLVVQYFLEMHRGYTLTARHFSLERSVVRSWVRRYCNDPALSAHIMPLKPL